MKMIGWIARLPKENVPPARIGRVAGGIGAALLLAMTGSVLAQTPAPDAQPVTQDGYVVHHSADLGGHIANVTGSGAMYDTLINIHSGPRVLGETFTMHALPTTKHTLFDSLTAFSNGFGGDPNNFAKLDVSKGKLYEFSGLFRRDRQYFDYDLLGNANIPGGQTIPIGPSNAPVGALTWPQQQHSTVMMNTVRRMSDTYLTLLPLSKVTFRVGYSQNIFQGPTLTPSGYTIGKYDDLLQEYERNGTDDFTGAVDWKPVAHTKLTFEEQVNHYKGDSYFTLNPNGFLVQEADGTRVSMGNEDSLTPYGIGGCNTGSMGSAYTNATTYTILSPAQTPGGLPVINPACDVLSSYLRSQPTRILTPTEILRFQSSSIRNIALNGDVRYTRANMNLPHYYETWTGLDGAIREATFTGNSTAKRQVIAFDYGMTWDATKTISLSDQIEFSNVHQPGVANISAGVTANTPTTTVAGNNGYETVNYSGALTPGSTTIEGNPNGTPAPGYFGQRWLTNNATATWDASTKATLSLTYRYRQHEVVQGAETGAGALVIDVNENGGIFNAALRPSKNWDLNGTVEIAYDDNAFTPVSPRQLKHYRLHTLYRVKPWATLSGAYNDLERHNNTFNTPTTYTGDGPLQHMDHSRFASMGLALTPNGHYGFDFNYSYSDVYTTTNACYLSGATPTTPGTASTTSTGGPNICPGVFARGSTTVLSDWGPVKDFADAPTQYASMALAVTPVKPVHADVGYRISAVSGNQFFNDARAVNGSLQSAYQSPFVNIAWTVHPGWVWRAEYNYYGYGEGGPSGAPYCSTSTSLTATVVPCSSFPGLTGITAPSSGFTAPRNFHANNVTLAMHYEF